MNQLKVTPSKLRDQANQFSAQAKQIQSLTNTMLTAIKSVNGATWSGDAANAYKKQFAALEGDMTQMFNMIMEYSKDLIEIAAEYEKAENSNASVAQALATDVIPN